MLASIKESGWDPIVPAALSLVLEPTDAELTVSLRNELASERDCFERIFGDWAAEHVLPPLNVILARMKHQSGGKVYGPIAREEFMRYFLASCGKQLLAHKKHQIPAGKIEEACSDLIGKNRYTAIHGCLNIPDHQLSDIFASWSQHLRQFVKPGSVCLVDETINSYYGKNAQDEGKLRSCPGKPYDFGMWIWAFTVRLQLSQLPVMIGLQPSFYNTDQSPGKAVVQLISQCLDPRPRPVFLIADSLWCNSATTEPLQELGVNYLVSLKGNNKLMPDSLIELAKSDLPPNATRTYSKGSNVLQVRGTANGTTFGLVTNCWAPADLHAPREHHLTYETALAFNKNETQASLVKAFSLPQNDLQLTLPTLICKITGWDVLRPPGKQDASEPINYAHAKMWSKDTVRQFYQNKLKRQANTSMTKQKMLAELFPDEAESQAEEPALAEEEVAAVVSTRERVQNLAALREEVRNFPIWLFSY